MNKEKVNNKEIKNKQKLKKPLKERNKFLYFITAPFRLIYSFVIAICILIWYYILEPIVKFVKKNYKHLWQGFVLSMLILNTIFTLRATERNRRNIDKQTEALNNVTQLIEEYKIQMDIYKQELDTYKEEQNTIQEETTERIDSLNKKVSSRSSSERIIGTTQPKSELQEYAHNLVINEYGWTENDFTCLVNLWNRESGWNPNAHNSSSGAHGIPQALPASKMASEGDDYYTNGKTQIRWRT